MKLKELITTDLNLDITGVTDDSRLVKEGYIFVATKGYNVDHYDYIEDAEFNDEKAAKQRKMMTQKEMQKAMDEKIKTNIKYYV